MKPSNITPDARMIAGEGVRDIERPLDTEDPRRARHRTHMQLRTMSVDDPEPLSGSSMRSGRHTPVPEHTKGRLEKTARGRAKVWKAPFWKRRKLRRAERARQEDELRRQL